MAVKKNITDTVFIVLMWLVAVALAYVVIVKIKFLIH